MGLLLLIKKLSIFCTTIEKEKSGQRLCEVWRGVWRGYLMAELEVGCKRPPVYYVVVTVQTAALQDSYHYNP